MFKRIGTIVALLLTGCTAVYADGMLPYFGGEIGYDTGKWKIRDVTGAKVTPKSNGALAGLFAGLSWTLAPKFIVNTEIFGNYSSTGTSNQTINITGGGTTQASMRMRYSYGATLMPGFKFNEAAKIYLRAGVIRSLFNLHQTTPPVGAGSNLSQNNVGGGQFGVGIQGDVGNAWGVRAEYDYMTYNSFTAFGNTISPRDNQIKVGVLYNFY